MKKRSKPKVAKPKKTATKKKIAKKIAKKSATKKSPAKKVTRRKPSFSAEEFIKKMERTYSAKLPAVYKKFLTDRLYVKYPKVEMTGFIRGPYFLDFTDSDLSNTKELGWNSGIHDMDDCNWSEDYVGYAPLASMSIASPCASRRFPAMSVPCRSCNLSRAKRSMAPDFGGGGRVCPAPSKRSARGGLRPSRCHAGASAGASPSATPSPAAASRPSP